MADILRHYLGLNVLNPAVDVINALLVQHVSVSIKQSLSLVSRGVLKLLPLPFQFIQSRINNASQVWLLVLDPLSITDQFLQLVLVGLNLRLECLQSQIDNE